MIREDFYVGAVVITPDGHVGKITSRQCGPLTLWGINDQKPRWREDQLRLPDEPEPVPQAEVVCRSCRLAGRKHDARHCGGEGGVIDATGASPCGCECRNRKPRRNDFDERWAAL